MTGNVITVGLTGPREQSAWFCRRRGYGRLCATLRRGGPVGNLCRDRVAIAIAYFLSARLSLALLRSPTALRCSGLPRAWQPASLLS